MIYFDATDSNVDAKVYQHCAPLFATGQFLQGGHDTGTVNATVSFVRYQSRFYAVTCHHVLSAFFIAACTRPYRLAPAIHTGRAILNFANTDEEGRYRWSFVSCRRFPEAAHVASDAAMKANKEALERLQRENASRPDIAIADITEIWPTLQTHRNAQAIDLDAWQPPDWKVVQPVWLAYGFPDRHKTLGGDHVQAPMPRVAAELASGLPSEDKPTFTLCSTLDREHGWGFSGMSGGPVLVAHSTEDRFAFVGITFEGAPASASPEQNDEAFVRKDDIVLTGYELTPQRFGQWLQAGAHGIEIS